MTTHSYYVTDSNDNQLEIQPDGTFIISNHAKGIADKYIFKSEEEIVRLRDWAVAVVEATEDPLTVKRNEFAQKLYGFKYRDVSDSAQELINELIEI